MFRAIALLFLATSSVLAQSFIPRVTVGSVAQLTARTKPFPNEVVEVLYKTSQGDIGSPIIFRWDSTNTLATNAIRLATTAGGTGRWVHEWNGNVKVFGAFGDEVVDDAVPIQAAAIVAGADRKRLLIPKGRYQLDAAVDFGDIDVEFEPGAVLILESQTYDFTRANIIAGPYQIFERGNSGSATPLFGAESSAQHMKFEWFGGRSNQQTDVAVFDNHDAMMFFQQVLGEASPPNNGKPAFWTTLHFQGHGYYFSPTHITKRFAWQGASKFFQYSERSGGTFFGPTTTTNQTYVFKFGTETSVAADDADPTTDVGDTQLLSWSMTGVKFTSRNATTGTASTKEITDAIVVIVSSFGTTWTDVLFQQVIGRSIRSRTNFEWTVNSMRFIDCGTDGDCNIYYGVPGNGGDGGSNEGRSHNHLVFNDLHFERCNGRAMWGHRDNYIHLFEVKGMQVEIFAKSLASGTTYTNLAEDTAVPLFEFGSLTHSTWSGVRISGWVTDEAYVAFNPLHKYSNNHDTYTNLWRIHSGRENIVVSGTIYGRGSRKGGTIAYLGYEVGSEPTTEDAETNQFALLYPYDAQLRFGGGFEVDSNIALYENGIEDLATTSTSNIITRAAFIDRSSAPNDFSGLVYSGFGYHAQGRTFLPLKRPVRSWRPFGELGYQTTTFSATNIFASATNQARPIMAYDPTALAQWGKVLRTEDSIDFARISMEGWKYQQRPVTVVVRGRAALRSLAGATNQIASTVPRLEWRLWNNSSNSFITYHTNIFNSTNWQILTHTIDTNYLDYASPIVGLVPKSTGSLVLDVYEIY